MVPYVAFLLCLWQLPQIGKATAVLTVQSPSSLECGEIFTLRCTFTGSLASAAARFWRKDSVNIFSGGSGTDARYTEDTSLSGSGYFELKITSFVSSDNGIYVCVNGFDTSPDTTVACTEPTTTTVPTTTSERPPIPDGGIVGIVLGVIALIAIIVGVCYCYWAGKLCFEKKKKNDGKEGDGNRVRNTEGTELRAEEKRPLPQPDHLNVQGRNTTLSPIRR